MVRALPPDGQPSVAFRDAACAILRLSRARGRGECEALGAVFEDDVSDDRRMLILDLLAMAGTPEAQVVMRRLLALPIARRSSRTFAAFVQRLAYLERPDAATLRYLEGVYAESVWEAHDVRAACANALGAAVARAHAWGLADAAARACEVLRRDLRAAEDPTWRCALLSAIGHAGLEADVPLVLRFVADPTPRVRSAAALALRKMQTPEARASLLSMLACEEPSVADSALSALFGQPLAEHELVRLAEMVLAGATPSALDGRVLRLIVTQKLTNLTAPARAVEDAIRLLLERVERRTAAPPRNGIGAATLRSREAPVSVGRSGERAAMRPPSAARLAAARKTPLPFSAGYRVIRRDDAEPATMSGVPSQEVRSRFATSIPMPAVPLAAAR